jgi:hypothetical protein
MVKKYSFYDCICDFCFNNLLVTGSDTECAIGVWWKCLKSAASLISRSQRQILNNV